MSDFDRCHFCGRLALEFHYESIAICDHCLSEEGDWHLFRQPDGTFTLGNFRGKERTEETLDFEEVAVGAFRAMYTLMLEMERHP